jgi:hypothetical protein
MLPSPIAGTDIPVYKVVNPVDIVRGEKSVLDTG